MPRKLLQNNQQRENLEPETIFCDCIVKTVTPNRVSRSYHLGSALCRLPAAAVLVFFAGAAGTGIVSADLGRGAYYLDIFRFAAGTHRGTALMESPHGAVVRGALRDAAALGARGGFFGTDPYQYQ